MPPYAILKGALVPQVSVVMACFNAGEYLKRSVSSVQRQSLIDWELLIIDDASTDSTQTVAKALADSDPRIRYIRSPVNAGPSASRNVGISRACGDWIAVLDADDAYCIERLEKLVHEGRDSDMVFDNLVLWDDDAQSETGFLISPSAGMNANFTLGDLIASEGPSRKWGLGFLKPLIRRDFLDQHILRYDEQLRLSEDFDLYARSILAGARAKFVNEALYLYTTQVGQSSGVRSLGTRTVFDNQSRVKLANRLIADHASAQASEMVWLRRYLRWQTLYANALDMAAARKQWKLGLLLRLAIKDPIAFGRFLATSRWLSPLLDRR